MQHRLQTSLRVAMLLLFAGACAPAQVSAEVDTPGAVSGPAAAGARLKHFSMLDEGVYKGSRPKGDADYRYLQSLHVKYIVDLQVIPLLTVLEKRKAKKYGITLIPGIMNASPISPSEKHIDKILAILHDERYHPVYFHCKFGRDRTNVIAALYRMYFLGMPPEDAKQYLRDAGYGFKFGWLRSGLTRYVRKHPTPPPALLSAIQTP